MSINIYRIILLIFLFFTCYSCNKDNGNGESDGLKSQYEPELYQTINLNIGNGLGVASDQTNFWVLTGQYNGNQHELIHYDPTTSSVIDYFTLNNLIGTTGTSVNGITWDGTYVWIGISGDENKLVKFNPQTEMIDQVLQVPETFGIRDLEWVEDKIWITSGTGEVYSMNPMIGTTQLVVSGYDPNYGIAFRNNELWVGDLNDNDIHVYDITNGAYRGIIENKLFNNGEFCFHDGKLAVLQDSEIRLYEISQ